MADLKSTTRGWRGSLALLPAIGVALLPNLTCPACWPAYAALLSSLGIGFLPTDKFLIPLTGVFLVFALAMLAWQARRRNRIGPLVLGSIGAAVIVLGRFVLQLDLVLYSGLAGFVTAAAWNAWPLQRKERSNRTVKSGSCPSCESRGLPVERLSQNKKQSVST